jgi:ATP-binding cassette subfamily C protein
MSSVPPDETARLERLRDSQRQTSQRVQKSLSRLKAVSRKRSSVRTVHDLDSAAAAVQYAFSHLGMDIEAERLAGASGDDLSIPDLARQAGGRARQVILTEGWQRREIGPLVGLLSGAHADATRDNRVVSLIRKGRYYRYIDHASGEQGMVTDALAARIHANAYSLYPALPEQADRLWPLLCFLWPAVRLDLGSIIVAGGLIALLGAAFPLATAVIVDTLIPGAESSLLVQIGIALGVGALVMFVFELTQGRAKQRIQGRSAGRLQAAVWDRTLRLPTAFFRRFSAGDLNARISELESFRETLLDFMLSAGVTAAFSIFYLVLLFVYLPQLAALAITMVALFAAASFATGWLKLKHIKQQARAGGRLSSLVFQFLQGIVKLRVAGAEGRAFAHWADRYADERHALAAVRRIDNHYTAFADAFQTLALAGLFAAAYHLAGQQVSAGIFIAFLAAYAAFQAAFLDLSRSVLSLFAAMPYLQRAASLLTADLEQKAGASRPGRLRGAIQVSKVSFAYSSGGEPVLRDLSLKIRPGETVALIGSSGSGKSTLLRVLLGFETPQAGTVLYDGQDLSSLDVAELRRQIGVVLQSGRIFAGSIFENIKGASEATLEDCRRAASDAGLDGDLELFPMGLHTPLTEGATTVSGGQRQRILIARALVKKPRILFMDEATSALDNRSQAIVTGSLERAAVTKLIIAHRLSTIRNADRIMVMERGQIVESGSYEDLIKMNGLFAKLARRQQV